MDKSRRQHGAPEAPKGFTLIELLIVIAIIGLLAAMVAGAAAKARSASRAVVCMNNLKTVGHEFYFFAEDTSRANRGDSHKLGKLFRLEDFQEKTYRIHEFWDAGNSVEAAIRASPLACPAAPGPLQKHKNLPCSSYAVKPLLNVSIGFNMRLEQVSTSVSGWSRLQRTRLSSRILQHPDVPLAFGVDGGQAAKNGVLPYYSAPPAGASGLYGTGRFWFPSWRHGKFLNVAYIGGHVMRTLDPTNSRKDFWRYEPPLQ